VRVLNLGISRSNYPEIEGRFGGVLVILGSGRCVWDDFQEFMTGSVVPDVMCMNDIVMHYPGPVRHFYSNDFNMGPKWLAARRPELRKSYGAVAYTHSCRDGAQYLWPWPGHGTSGLNAVYTGLALGYDSVVLCGIPLDDSGHYFDPPWIKSNFIKEVGLKGSGQIKYWRNAAEKVFEGRVTAMSGRVREMLDDL
jgi:hypothetical protein